jgi:hypothetical protein
MPGAVVDSFDCASSQPKLITRYSYLVFNDYPTTQNVSKIELLGAPDGISNFTPFDDTDTTTRRQLLRHRPHRPSSGGPTPLAGPVEGQLTIELNKDYDLDAEPGKYFEPRTGGADVGEVTAASDRLDAYESHTLPLPDGTSGTYAACKKLNWDGPNSSIS